MSKFSDNLTKIRTQKGISRKELAGLLDVTVQTYGAYENGKREPNIDKLGKLAAALHVSTDELLGYKAPNEHQRLVNFTRSCGLIVNEHNGLISVEISDDIKQGFSKADLSHIEKVNLEPLPVAEFDEAVQAAEKDLFKKNTKQATLILLDTLECWVMFNN